MQTNSNPAKRTAVYSVLRLAAMVVVAVLLLVLMGATAIYETVPGGNTTQGHFDAIIVLGSPAKADGTPSPLQRERVMEGVREYRAGVAPRLIMTGGPAHNHWVEATVMAQLAKSEGVPAMAVLEEDKAQNTVQNAFYSVKIMQEHGWHSAEVVSSKSHLARSSLIFARFPIQYRTHGAPPPTDAYTPIRWASYFYEIRSVAKIRLFGFTPSPFLP
jgi:uncharacterized SAM-binding protein YcdF (DUF218 family)